MNKEELLIVADAAGISKKKSTYGCSWNDLRRFAEMVKRRDMVELTDKEIHQILDDNLDRESLFGICKAVQSAVIRKNTWTYSN